MGIILAALGRVAGSYPRHYGNPAARLDAAQLEIAQSAYLKDANPDVRRRPRTAAECIVARAAKLVNRTPS